MAASTVPGGSKRAWQLARAQHGVIARAQLLTCGFSPKAVRERLERGRLHELHRGVYAVGRPEVTRLGRWMAALLACPDGAVLSHSSAAALWDLSREGLGIEVSVPRDNRVKRPGITAHRAVRLDPTDITRRHGIPVTRPARTLVDIAPRLSPRLLEAVINRADKLDLIDPERLLRYAGALPGSPGAAALRALLDRQSFRLTDSELERLFLRLVRKTGMPVPDTRVRLNGYVVDFHWRGLGLVVETDGLRYHRTASTQTRDAQRDRAHAAAGLTTVRFTHHEVRHEPGKVAAELARVVDRLANAGTSVSRSA